MPLSKGPPAEVNKKGVSYPLEGTVLGDALAAGIFYEGPEQFTESIPDILRMSGNSDYN
jgi:hypothetical protein